MAKGSGIALWVAVVVMAMAWQAGAQQVGKGLGKDNLTIAEIFTEDNFNAMFPNKDNRLSHAAGFYDYYSFLSAASLFEKEGFALKGGSETQKRELSAFLAHVAHETSCGWSGAVGGPYAWGLCYIQELSPASTYCEESILYACVNGVSYHGRGGLPIYYNTNYGPVGKALGIDLLTNPGLLSSNATLAFASALYYWIEALKPNPSPHSVLVNEWTPTKADNDNFRYAGFGLTINILAGHIECGHGDDSRADDRIGHYRAFTQILGVEDIGTELDCGLQGMLPTGYNVVLKKEI